MADSTGILAVVWVPREGTFYRLAREIFTDAVHYAINARDKMGEKKKIIRNYFSRVSQTRFLHYHVVRGLIDTI